jgi:predicted DCC family thiol-disulfide oxidoreductase YuxK
VFDGECVLCSANARFVLRRDRRRRFRLTTAQGALGEALYRHFGLPSDRYETMLLIESGRLRTESDAALAIAEGLGWPWRAAAAARLIPRPLRDAAYRLVARNRYRLFGRRHLCWTPGAADLDRIL